MAFKLNLNLFVFENRLASYEGKWRYTEGCTAEKMACAGFYCTEKRKNSDAAKCYVCQHEMLWDPEDDPWEEHKKHRPDCLLVKIGKQNEAEFTVREVLLLMAHVQSTKKYVWADESVNNLSALMTQLVLDTDKMIDFN
uniref:Survivin n=1 Tax=Globodera rostochiensis TaxID=31243 RepID=A0A914HFQ7_GLORO